VHRRDASGPVDRDYALITSVNLAGFFHLTQFVIGLMATQGSGHVVNVTTSLVDNADSKRPAALPALTKGGLAAATRSLAIEYASRGIRMNAVALRVIRTRDDPGSYAGMADLHPLGRSAKSATSSTGPSSSRGPHLSPERQSISTGVKLLDADPWSRDMDKPTLRSREPSLGGAHADRPISQAHDRLGLPWITPVEAHRAEGCAIATCVVDQILVDRGLNLTREPILPDLG